MRSFFALLVGLVLLVSPQVAWADDEATQLEAELSDLEAKLDGTDCAVLCEALASMERAADRLCELEAGERCDAARKRVAEAKRRVRSACPDCVAAQEQSRREPEGKAMGGAGEEDNDAAEVVTASEEGGGCASCTVGRRRGSGGPLALVSALALLLSSRRRRSARAGRRAHPARNKERT